jgi:hypothetical protein
MDPEEEDTVVRPPAPLFEDPADVDADTIIRGRQPFADVPPEVLAAFRPEALVPAAASSSAVASFGFRVGTNDPVGLESPVLIGRHPRLPRIMSGRAPRLVDVPSPSREISGTHIELRQEGAMVVVTDLRSTNGTVVRAPGREPVKLRQGESVVVMPGTFVDIGDHTLVEILALQQGDQPERRPS